MVGPLPPWRQLTSAGWRVLTQHAEADYPRRDDLKNGESVEDAQQRRRMHRLVPGEDPAEEPLLHGPLH